MQYIDNLYLSRLLEKSGNFMWSGKWPPWDNTFLQIHILLLWVVQAQNFLNASHVLDHFGLTMFHFSDALPRVLFCIKSFVCVLSEEAA